MVGIPIEEEILSKSAADADLDMVNLQENKITISVSLPSRGGEVWLIRSDDIVHIDMCPSSILGSIEFGGLSLPPPSYAATRNFDYGGEDEDYRVLRITDVDDKVGYLVLFGREEIITPSNA